MLRHLIVFYVGFIVALICAGMVIASASGFGSKIFQSPETVKISEIDTSEFRDVQPSGIFVEMEGPLVRDLFQNNPFKELPDKSISSID